LVTQKPFLVLVIRFWFQAKEPDNEPKTKNEKRKTKNKKR